VTIRVTETESVSGLMQSPPRAKACVVIAPGAGAGIQHPFMAGVADDLASLGMATLRDQFPYMERHGKRPDAPALCHLTVRAAVASAHQFAPGLTLIAGGKSFGGRMTSQTQAELPLPLVRGLVFLGFPLHPPKQASDTRGEHLFQVQIPMLFLQGTRDAFAEMPLMQALIGQLGTRASLTVLEDADHSFHVPARTGRTDTEVRIEMLGALAAWAESLL
jgi:predicted alpha/beta-hydrolase family hydrolase